MFLRWRIEEIIELYILLSLEVKILHIGLKMKCFNVVCLELSNDSQHSRILWTFWCERKMCRGWIVDGWMKTSTIEIERWRYWKVRWFWWNQQVILSRCRFKNKVCLTVNLKTRMPLKLHWVHSILHVILTLNARMVHLMIQKA